MNSLASECPRPLADLLELLVDRDGTPAEQPHDNALHHTLVVTEGLLGGWVDHDEAEGLWTDVAGYVPAEVEDVVGQFSTAWDHGIVPPQDWHLWANRITKAAGEALAE